MDPMEALETAEHALRLAIREVMGGAWMKSPSAPAAPQLERRRVDEARKRPGVEVSTDPLDFTLTGDLRKIILENEVQFLEVFPDFDVVKGFTAFIVSVRNTVAHNRPLAFYEREVLSGIAGVIRNAVSVYRANCDPVNRYYPLIESVRDSRGSEGAELIDSMSRPAKRIDVGEKVAFDCRAWDHQQDRRQIQWALVSGSAYIEALVMESVPQDWLAADEKGNASLTWQAAESDVSESLGVVVVMRHTGKNHKVRPGHSGLGGIGYDDSRYFRYAVNPPLD